MTTKFYMLFWSAVSLSVCLQLIAVDTCHASAIVFRSSSTGYLDPDVIPGINHVGLDVGGMVWESHPGYQYVDDSIPFVVLRDLAWDPDRSQRVSVPTVNGVQRLHTSGSFKWDSGRTTSSPVTEYISFDISDSLASQLESQLMLVQGFSYPSLGGNPYNLVPSRQKGSNNEFTCVGLIEYAAELAGFNNGEGIIPNEHEQIVITPAFKVLGLSVPPVTAPVLLTPQLMLKALQEGWEPGKNKPVKGIIDPVDFLLTDPQGRRVGYTVATGMINEIPGMSYSGDGDNEQLLLSNPEPGTYTLELFGLDDHAEVAISDGNGGGIYFSGFLAQGQTLVETFLIPSLTVGDFDDDGDVDGVDIAEMFSNFNGPGGGVPVNPDTDLDGDGDVDGVDLATLFAAFTGPLAPVNVPEPASLALLVAGGLLLAGRRR